MIINVTYGVTGILYASSTKTKLNTSSSTEIVAVGEKLLKNIRFRHYRFSQGGDNNEGVLSQDNDAAILLENNGAIWKSTKTY